MEWYSNPSVANVKRRYKTSSVWSVDLNIKGCHVSDQHENVAVVLPTSIQNLWQ